MKYLLPILKTPSSRYEDDPCGMNDREWAESVGIPVAPRLKNAEDLFWQSTVTEIEDHCPWLPGSPVGTIVDVDIVHEVLSAKTAKLSPNKIWKHDRETASKIRAKRRRMGWTQADMATHFGVSTIFISHVEQGRKSPPQRLVLWSKL
jgi:DNA-binding XRE family transcriptional regulator